MTDIKEIEKEEEVLEIWMRDRFAGHVSRNFWKNWKEIKPVILDVMLADRSKLEERIRELEECLQNEKNNTYENAEAHDSWIKKMNNQIASLEAKLKSSLMANKVFHDHIKAHFEKEHPDWEVCCKICGMTYDDIVKLELMKKQEEG